MPAVKGRSGYGSVCIDAQSTGRSVEEDHLGFIECCGIKPKCQLLEHIERFVELVVGAFSQSHGINLDADVRHHT